MKSPSRNVTRSLAGQRPGGRGEESISVSEMGGKPSMVVPGEGGTESAPGGEHERSAAKYVAPQRRFGG